MTQIPSHIAGSSLQAGQQAQNLAEVQDRQKAADAERTSQQARASETASERVEEDAAVFTDAEGAGSQGRAFQENEDQQAETPPDDEQPPEGYTRGEDGQLHLDIEA